MARTHGSKNVAPFEQRKDIRTTDSSAILHMADYHSSALNHFRQIIANQNNFLGWMKNSQDQLKMLKNEKNTRLGLSGNNALSVKNKPYNKYKWYIQQTFLLELINGFEVYYKRSIIRLAEIIKTYINPDTLKGEVDAKVLWYANNSTSLISLVFEKKLFHDLSTVDEATNMLIGNKRYNPNNKKGQFYNNVVRKLQAIFQIRHTLSHNSGYVTDSDAAKLQNLGYVIISNKVIDPTCNGLSLSITRFLRTEAEEFCVWLRESTKSYIINSSQKITESERDMLKANFGGDDAYWSNIVK